MAAAYGSLISLRTLIDQIQGHQRPPITLHQQHAQSLFSNITFLQEFLETYSHNAIEEASQGLERLIAKVAYAAADAIESHIADQIHSGSMSHGTEIHPQLMDLHEIIGNMSSVMEEAMVAEKKLQAEDHQFHRRLISDSTWERSPSLGLKSTSTVGFDDVLHQVLDKLTGYPSSLQIIPIVGMGGIGKTTLASNAYEHHHAMEHFDTRSWVIVSQDYNVRDILSKLLDKKDISNASEENLGQELYQKLFGRRYLIVMDDMWNVDVWNQIKRFFRNNDDGSRVIVTTRLLSVATELSQNNIVTVNFLDEQKSWNLLSNIVFGKEVCPNELVESGRKIAEHCKGLPLSIIVMGGLLAKSKRRQEDWGFIAEKLNSSVNFEHEQLCSQILRTSLDYMPIHLKPCFLYMGIFLEDEEIKVSKLIKLWVAEGFVKPMSGKSVELAAREYLKDLIDRNLILVKGLGCIGGIKTCNMHDVTRELCIKEAEKDGFLYIATKHNLGIQQGTEAQRRIAIHGRGLEDGHLDEAIDALLSSSRDAHSVWYDAVSPKFYSRMRRVLNVTYSPFQGLSRAWNATKSHDQNVREFRERIKLFFQNMICENMTLSLNLRFFGMKLNTDLGLDLPTSMYLWNLQTLIIGISFKEKAPLEIWKMHQLKHVKVRRLRLPQPPQAAHDDELVLRDLQTLSELEDFRFSEEAIKRIPNIRKLKYSMCTIVDIETLLELRLSNLGRLQKLESLNCYFVGWGRRPASLSLPQIIAFPKSLIKLRLMGVKLDWEEVTSVIGSLPHLQALKLIATVSGVEWNLEEGKFQSLRFLLIQTCDLAYWTAESDHFPCLEHLSLTILKKLKEIPPGIGDAPNLQSIELKWCEDPLVNSAQNILDEQYDLGNDGLKVRVWDVMKERFVELRPHPNVQ